MSKKKRRFNQPVTNKPPEANTPTVSPKSAKFNIAIFTLLSLCAILIYSNSLKSPFIWDDQYLITDNHFIKSAKYIPEFFKHQLYYSTAGMSNFYRPLQTFFLMIDYSIWKMNPAGYHITNILFHILSAFFIYLVIILIFQHRVIACLVSLLFLVHPINSTVVNYISSRADSQVTLFSLVSFWAFFRSLSVIQKNKSRLYYALSLISFILALLSKELGVILPLLILVSLPIISKNINPGKAPNYRKTIPLFIILITYAILRLTVLHYPGGGVGVPAPLYIRLLTSAESFVRLIGLLFAPRAIHIEKSIPFSAGLTDPRTFLSVGLLIIIGALAYRIQKKSTMCFLGLVWFFAALLPMANIIPINATIADHWLYLPSFGFFLAVVGGTYDLIKNNDRRKGIVYALLVIYSIAIVILSFMTIKQNRIWNEPLEFYKVALIFNPQSYRAHNEIGVIYLDQGKYDLAIPEFKKSIEVNSSFDQAYDNLGVAYDKSGRLVEAVNEHLKSLEINPYNAKTYNNLGNAYNRMSQFDNAIEAYEKALQLNPDYKAVHNNLGVIYYKKGMFGRAEEYWNRALAIDPNFQTARDNLKAIPADK